MPNPVEAMLARWPLLYAEIMDIKGLDYDLPREAARVRQEVIAPLLEADDVQNAFEEARIRYQRWRDSFSPVAGDLETVLALEDEKADALTAAFGVHNEELGEQAIRATSESIRLRRIVRRSTLPHREIWPEESWERIGDLMASSELCLAALLEYLATEEGWRDNVETLARWGFENALNAYWDAGYFGKERTRDEDLPWPCPGEY